MIQPWQVTRAINLDRIRPGRLVVFNAYWPTYGIDAGLVCMALTGIDVYQDEEAVRCWFPARRAILWVPLRHFKIGTAKCLTFEELKLPRKPVITFDERFKPREGKAAFDPMKYFIDPSAPGFVQKFI